jgi:CheY-like chemotaxis protein
VSILIAEDEAITRLILQRAVEKLGYACLVARDGAEAWHLFQDTEVDVVISDWMMPGVDGIELCRRVRASGREAYPYFILLTALGDKEHLLAGMRAGADDYLTKPLDQDELRVRLLAAARVTLVYRELASQRRQLLAELARAAQVQAELLPREVPRLAGCQLAARCVPAREVGGDFYDWQEVAPGVLTLTLGDVSGKGMPAALLMATVRTALRAVARQHTPAAAVGLAARTLESDLERSESFVTLFHAQFDVAGRRLTYVDAGHGHVFVRRADGTAERLEAGGLPLGILPDETYAEGSMALQPGDTLVVYSDGLVDARPDLELTPATLAGQLSAAASAGETVDRLLALVDPGGMPPDDLTVVALCCRGGEPHGRGTELALGRGVPGGARTPVGTSDE